MALGKWNRACAAGPSVAPGAPVPAAGRGGAFERGGVGACRLGGGRRRGSECGAQRVVEPRAAVGCRVTAGRRRRRRACDGVDEHGARIDAPNAMVVSVRDQDEGAVAGAER